MKQTKLDKLDEAAKVVSVGQHEADQASKRMDEAKQILDDMSTGLDNLEAETANNQQQLLDLQSEIQGVLEGVDLSKVNIDIDEIERIENLPTELESIKLEKHSIDLPHLDYVDVTNNWDDLLSASEEYATKYDINLSNPYFACLSESEINQLSSMLTDKYELSKLKKEDYIFASTVGIIGGWIDVFFVGSITDGNKKNPTSYQQGILGKKTDQAFDKFVTKYAEFRSGKKFDSKSKAIKELEKMFKVSYDASNNARVNDPIGIVGMNPSNHHLKSVSHDPGILGLITSIFDQLDGKSTFFSDGTIKRVATMSKEAKRVKDAKSLPEKIILAIDNWFGHCCSDITGASSSKYRGAGLPMPFYSVTQSLNFGNVNIKKGKSGTYAEVAEWLYKQGLDTRAFAAQSIPVLVMETLVRLFWIYKRHFYYGKEWKECIPIANEPDLQTLLLVSTASFATVDVADAVTRNGNNVKALLRINFANAYDLGTRSVQVFKSRLQRAKKIDQLKHETELQWDEIYKEI